MDKLVILLLLFFLFLFIFLFSTNGGCSSSTKLETSNTGALTILAPVNTHTTVQSTIPYSLSAATIVTDWNNVAQLIFNSYNKSKAFIVVHELQHMTYTSAILAFVLENLKKPVVICVAKDLDTVVCSIDKFRLGVSIVINDRILRGCNTNHVLGTIKGKKIKIVDSSTNEDLVEELKLYSLNPALVIPTLFTVPGIDLRRNIPLSSDAVIVDMNGMTNNDQLSILMQELETNNVPCAVANDTSVEALFAKLSLILSNVPNARKNCPLTRKLLEINMRGEKRVG